jgi:hypothetical protein
MISGWANPETAEVLARLESWRERDWLRRLDVAFARFMAALPNIRRLLV